MERKPNAASDQTKHALAEALKTLMAQKPFDKITIRDITELAGIRRQNFYYHFEDVYDLMRWMFEEEAISLLRRHEGTLLWQDGFLQLFQYLDENRAICLCALRSVGRDCLKRFFKADIYAVIHRTVEQLGEDIGVLDALGGNADVEMMTHFYIIAAAGVVESWLTGEIDKTPQELIAFMDQAICDHMRGAQLRIQEMNNG